mmetsp:Transcript_36899/g.63698  ORF Transcript_36899/g.63698 Transcript_36899/m.63698 type:complete len:837 (-) Transcript_36899:351-2861(-)
MRVQLLAEITDHARIVELVVLQELKRVSVEGDVDLTDGVVSGGLGVALGNAGLQPGVQQTQAVAALGLLHELSHGAELAHRVHQRAQKLLIALQVQQLAHDLRGLLGGNLLHVHLDVLLQVAVVEVRGQLVHEVEAVTDVDQRAGIGQLGLHQELLDGLRLIDGAVSADALHLLELLHARGGLDVLDVHQGQLREVHDGTEVVEQTLEGLEVLEQVDQGLRTQGVAVLGGDLHHDVQVLADVAAQHLLQDLQTALTTHRAEEGQQELGVQTGGVGLNHALDVRHVGVVLEGALGQACLLAQTTDVGLVVVGEHLVAEDGVSHLGHAAEEVDLQQLGLQETLLLAVALQGLQQESSGLTQKTHGHEDLQHGVGVNQLHAGLIVGQLLGEVQGTLRVAAHKLLQHVAVVDVVVGALGVSHDLIELSLLHVAVDHLLGHVGTQEDGQGHVHINGHHQVTELLGEEKLVFRDPLLQQLGAALLDHGLGQLDGLQLVQLALLQQHREVLEDRLGLARHRRHLLEAQDGGGGAQDATRRLGGDFGGTLNVARSDEGVELGGVQVVSTGQVQARSNVDRELLIAQLADNVRHQSALVEAHLQHLTLAGDGKDAAGRGVLGGGEHRVHGDAGAVHGLAGENVEQEEVTHLGNHVHHAVRLRGVHGDGEIVGRIGGGGDGLRSHAEHTTGGSLVATHLHDEQLGRLLGLLVLENQHLCGLIAARHVDHGEHTGVALEHLGDRLLDGVQLHVAVDHTRSGARRDAAQQAPLAIAGHLVVDDLSALGQGGVAVEDLHRRGVTFDGPVEHGSGGHQRNAVGGNPSPVSHGGRHIMALHLGSQLKVENL